MTKDTHIVVGPLMSLAPPETKRHVEIHHNVTLQVMSMAGIIILTPDGEAIETVTPEPDTEDTP